MARESSPSGEVSRQDALYLEAATSYGGAMDRLARAYEADGESRRDLLQEIHVALWRSFATYDGRCSLRTWVYRVAHNVAASHVVRGRRAISGRFATLAELDALPSSDDTETAVERREASRRLLGLIQLLNPIERQIIVLYLEGLDAAAVGEITGLSAANVATRVHRIKSLLSRHFHGGAHHE